MGTSCVANLESEIETFRTENVSRAEFDQLKTDMAKSHEKTKQETIGELTVQLQKVFKNVKTNNPELNEVKTQKAMQDEQNDLDSTKIKSKIDDAKEKVETTFIGNPLVSSTPVQKEQENNKILTSFEKQMEFYDKVDEYHQKESEMSAAYMEKNDGINPTPITERNAFNKFQTP